MAKTKYTGPGSGKDQTYGERPISPPHEPLRKGFKIKRDKDGSGFSMVVQKKLKGFEEGNDMSQQEINELSKSTLKSYVKKAAKDIGQRSYHAGVSSDLEGGMKDLEKSERREKGISKAVHRIGGKYYPNYVKKRNPTFGGHRKYKASGEYGAKVRHTRKEEYELDEAEGIKTVSTKGYSGSKPMKPQYRTGTKGFINWKGGQPAADADKEVLAWHKGEAAKAGKVVQLRYRGPRHKVGEPWSGRGPQQAHTTKGAGTGAAVYYKDAWQLGGRQRAKHYGWDKRNEETVQSAITRMIREHIQEKKNATIS